MNILKSDNFYPHYTLMLRFVAENEMHGSFMDR